VVYAVLDGIEVSRDFRLQIQTVEKSTLTKRRLSILLILVFVALWLSLYRHILIGYDHSIPDSFCLIQGIIGPLQDLQYWVD
jgi:hypothetical protein